MREYRTALMDNRRWEQFKPRPDDIFVCTPAKCGTTWTQTIVGNLLWPHGDLPAPIMMLSPWIEAEFMPAEGMFPMLEAQTHRRFMKSHTAADGIPWFDDAKYIFVARDGRDAFMSLCNHVERLNDREFNLGLATNEQKALNLIDTALRKIKDGNYGVCETCSKTITQKRLMAMPHALLCIKCQEIEEKKRHPS